MPIFDYLCPECGAYLYEVLVRRWDDEVKCSSCGVVAKKLLSAPAIKSLNTSEKLDAALRKRSLTHSRKNKDEAINNYQKQIRKAKKI